MNLHGIAVGYVAAINPMITAMLTANAGSTTAPDGSRVPAYADPVPVQCQVQSLTYNDLQQLDGLNIQGVKRAIYLPGQWDGVIRADQRGGDTLTMPNGDTYLVVLVLEQWPDWCKLAVVLQDGT